MNTHNLQCIYVLGCVRLWWVSSLHIKPSATVSALLLLHNLAALVVYSCQYVGVASSDYSLTTCPRFGFQLYLGWPVG